MKNKLEDGRRKSEAAIVNILIIGGTTEGRVAVQVCDEAAKPYFYSTKNDAQQVECAHGKRVSGGLDERTMPHFCRQNNIRLIVDAAHPFAENVHRNIGLAAQSLGIPVIRFERNFPPPNPKLHWLADFDEAIAFLHEKNIENLLALTGVNTIPKLKPFWSKHTCAFRIMNRPESLAAVEKSGFPRENILFYDDERDDIALFRRLRPQAIITKESGESGGFAEKTEAALALDIPVLVIRRPKLPYAATETVFGKYGLRKQIERLLPDFFQLKTGYTTGSCATAATKAALTAILSGEEQTEISISLPNNEPITIAVVRTVFEPDGSVTCTVVKDAGDDPDVTHGLEICANVRLNASHAEIRFLQGEGVGKVTLPGLGIEIGTPAINATPRKMITREVRETIEKLSDDALPTGVDITVFVPRGEEVARRTFNPKLGIVGGISIIGTSGIVKPYSSEAFVASIRREVQVAKALNVNRLVLNSGAKSEKYLKLLYPQLPPQAFVQYGNFIGETLQAASDEGFRHVTLGIMIGKAVKLAEGLLDTHSKKAVMNKEFIVSLARQANCSPETVAKIEQMVLARDLWTIVPETEKSFFSLLLNRCSDTCNPLLPNGKLTLLLIDEEGRMVSE